MRIPLLISALFLFCFMPHPKALATESTIPSSNKSQDCYRRVAPKLIQAMKKKGLSLGDPVFIRLFKTEQQLEVWIRKGFSYVLFKSYTICFQSGTIGPKIREGDKQGPEGFYKVTAKQLNPNSDYHLSFNLGFPNEYDKSYKRTGSLLMVHGRCSSVGCFAMTDFRMDEIYALVESAIISGQQQVPVHIFPFKMTKVNMASHKDSKWINFWENLKEGYDFFEGYHLPPLVTVKDKRYQFTNLKSMFFGGTLPPVPPQTRQEQGSIAQNTVERKRAPTTLSPRKKQQLTAKREVPPNPAPSPPKPLYLGD